MKLILSIILFVSIFCGYQYLIRGPLEREIPSEVMTSWKRSYKKLKAYDHLQAGELINNIDDVIRINKRLNDLANLDACGYDNEKKVYKYPKLKEEAAELISKYKAFPYTFDSWFCPDVKKVLPVDKESVFSAIRKQEERHFDFLSPQCAYSVESFEKCFDSKNKSENPHCRVFGLNLKDSGIYKYVIQDDASYKEIKVNSINDLSDQELGVSSAFPKELNESNYYSCVADWWAGNRTIDRYIINTIDEPAFGRPVYYVQGPSEIKNECTIVNENVKNNIFKFNQTFDRHLKEGYTLKKWIDYFDERVKLCESAIQEECKNVSSYNGKYYISYVTKERRVRDVTADDIDDDIIRFKSQGMTEAETFNHASMKDTIQVCEDMEKAGFSWRYENPNQKKRTMKK